MYRGEIVFQFLHDLGGEVRMGEAARRLASVVATERLEPTKSAPPYVDVVRPLALAFPSRTVETSRGSLTVALEAHLYAIGAACVVVRVPFVCADLESLSDLTHARPLEGPTFGEMAESIVADMRRTLHGAIVETYEVRIEPETYQVIVLTGSPRPAMELFEKERQWLAGLVAGERRPERLSDEEVRDNLRTWFRYYDDDLVVVDWDRALVIEPSGRYDDVLSVMEAANLELLELRAYDRYLDVVLEQAYEDLTRFYGRGGLFRSARGVQEELSNARIDLVRVTDAINNIGKIFGDYYLAKLHLGLTERFHLREWETIVREKMATLNDLYMLASHEVEHRRGMALETMIVLLFVIDLVFIFIVSGK